MQSFFQLFFKILSRAPLYVRGLVLWMNIRACGGTCASIPQVHKGFVLKYPPHAGLKLGHGLRIGPHCMIECPAGARLSIGDRVGLTAGVILSANFDVFIGDDCLIAEWVSIRDAEHSAHIGATIASQPLKLARVYIGNDVWIGRSSLILQGAHVGNGCIIGANSFLKNKTAEAFGVYVGTPAARIKTRAA